MPVMNKAYPDWHKYRLMKGPRMVRATKRMVRLYAERTCTGMHLPIARHASIHSHLFDYSLCAPAQYWQHK